MTYYFPQQNICDLERTSRRISTYNLYKTAHDWSNELDNDDFIDIWLNDKIMPINYNLINRFLLSLNYTSYIDEYNKLINELYKIYNNIHNISYINFNKLLMGDLIKTIINLYTSLYLMPDSIYYLNGETTILYHGIEFLEEPFVYYLNNIQTGEIFKIPTFMSTSIIIDTAARFSINYKKIIKINILKKFKYIYFGKDVNIQDNNSFVENEILLNVLSKIKFKKKFKNKIKYKEPTINENLIENTNVYTIYEFDFLEHSKLTPENFNNYIKNFII